MNRDAWLAERRTGIGGSDIAAVLGMSPYKTPFQVWLEKTARAIEQTTPEQEERMHWGNVLEDVVARHYATVRLCAVQRINKMMRHRKHDCLLANVDRVRVVPGSRARLDEQRAMVLGADAVIECKTASAFALRTDGASDAYGWGDPGTDQVPQHYWLQVQHYMGITGIEQAEIAVLFGGQKFATYSVSFDAALMRDVFEQAAAWWVQHIVGDIPPNPQSETEARIAWAASKEGKVAQATDEVARAVQELQEVRAAIAHLQEQEQQLRDRITCAIGDAEALVWHGQPIATWKSNKPSQKTDWQAVAMAAGASQALIDANTETKPGTRVLRIKQPKE